MTAAPAPHWRRLAPLSVGVLALHLALLQPPLPSFRSRAAAPVRLFAVREVEDPRGREAVREGVETTAPAPAPARAPAPAHRPAAVPTSTPAVRPKNPRPDTPGAISASPPPVEPSEPPAGAPSPAPPSSHATTPPPPLSIPPPARHRYVVVAQVRGVTLEGEAELEWRHDGQAYEARLALRTPPLPARTQRSTGRLTAHGLAPDYFSDRSRSEQATHFDREQGRVVFSANRPQAPLVEGLQDRLSVLLQLSALFAGDPARYPAGSRIVLPTAGTREAGEWIFEVEGEEELLLPGGAVRTVRLRRPPRHPYDQRMELWLAAGGDYAPVRLRLTNPNGDTADQRWSATDRG